MASQRTGLLLLLLLLLNLGGLTLDLTGASERTVHLATNHANTNFNGVQGENAGIDERASLQRSASAHKVLVGGGDACQTPVESAGTPRQGQTSAHPQLVERTP